MIDCRTKLQSLCYAFIGLQRCRVVGWEDESCQSIGCLVRMPVGCLVRIQRDGHNHIFCLRIGCRNTQCFFLARSNYLISAADASSQAAIHKKLMNLTSDCWHIPLTESTRTFLACTKTIRKRTHENSTTASVTLCGD